MPEPVDPTETGTETAGDPDAALTPAEVVRRLAEADVARELAALAARAAPRPVTDGRGRRARRPATGASVVYSVRLGHDEVAALRRRAAVLGIGATALARAYVREGLRSAGGTVGEHAVDEAMTAVARLRDLVR